MINVLAEVIGKEDWEASATFIAKTESGIGGYCVPIGVLVNGKENM